MTTAALNTVQLQDRTITIRELTVAEVRTWAKEMEAGAAVDPLRCMVFDECSLDDLARMGDCPADALESFKPSELRLLLDKAKAMNPYFFKVREVLFGISRVMTAEVEAGLIS